MNNTILDAVRVLFRSAQPWSLLGGIFFYGLGVGIAQYLGDPIDGRIYWLGQACVTLLQMSSFYLKHYFDLPSPPRRKDIEAGEGKLDLPKPVWLQAGITTMTVGAVVTVLLFAQQALDLGGLILLGVGFIVLFFYAVPPLRLADSGYGELIQAFFVASLTPFIAYSLQAGSLHRLLWMLSLPLTSLYLATIMALTLRRAPEHIRAGRQNIWARAGWQRGFILHNLLVLGAFVLLGVSSLLGLPWTLSLPGFLALPTAIFQVIHMNQIADGGKPRWRLLSTLALATLGIAVYSITLTLWIR